MEWAAAIRRTVEDRLYPALREIAPQHRDRALRRAAAEPFDLAEWIGITFGMMSAVSLTRYGAAGLGVADRLVLAAVNVAVALPLLAVLVGPFLVRRKRRGLRAFLREHAPRP